MRSSQLQANAVDILQNCINADGVMLVGLEVGEAKWNGKVVQTLSDAATDAIQEEILWELSELNFHFELLALHSRATTCPEHDPQALISHCFSGGSSPSLLSLLIADLGTANYGLASVD